MCTLRSSFTCKKRTIVIVLFFAVAMILMVPLTAYAQEAGKTVRVGWYESPFNTMDQFGRRSGYAYDYQQKTSFPLSRKKAGVNKGSVQAELIETTWGL